MGKYLILWETDPTKFPDDRKQIGRANELLVAAVKEDFKKGKLKDWGAFMAETNGYAVIEGEPVEISIMLNQYAPFVRFTVKQIHSIDDVAEINKSLLK